MKLLEREGIDLQGENAVVLGRSETVGKPMAMLLLNANATVTVCHSKTQNLKEICRNADVLISAIGKSKFVTADMVKDGAVVIDVGINRDEFGKLCGDVDFENVKDKTSFITPVPGGVGPMTITMLMYNTYITACKE
jgi:methylenetetrahydrofolate dehydrogenase (NADP+)/methenyltetrahydrofolate cyclohydrolase